MARGKGITKAEDIAIKLLLQRGKKVVYIAEGLGRSRIAIYKRIKRMKETGEINQIVADFGQLDE